MPIARHGNSLVVGGSSNSIPGILFSSPYVATELWIKSPLSSYVHPPPPLFLHEKGLRCKKMRIRICFQSGVSLYSQQHHSLALFLHFVSEKHNPQGVLFTTGLCRCRLKGTSGCSIQYFATYTTKPYFDMRKSILL